MSIINWILENYESILSSAVGILTAGIAIALIVPGEQPEKFMQWLLDLLKKLSKK